MTAISDIICLHIPHVPETHHILNRERMLNMKLGVIVINTARGGLIDEEAAYELLLSGHIGGMGLDAYEVEPPAKSPLLELDNVVATPHTAAHTAEAVSNMADMAVDNLIKHLSR